MLSSIPFVFTNQTDQQVNFALYGLDSGTGHWSYFQGTQSGDTFSGSLIPAAQLGAGNTLPTFSFNGPSATLHVPDMPAGFASATIVLTVGSVAPSLTVASNHTIPRPSPSNPDLVNATTNAYYDFIEFTVDANRTLYINTTQVDQFGFPITLASTPATPHAPAGTTPGVSRAEIFEAFVGFLHQEQDPAALDYLTLLIDGGDGGSPQRIISPGQYLATPGKDQPSNPLAGYFDATIEQFFTSPPSLTLVSLNPYGNSGDPGAFTFVGTATTRNPVASGDLIHGVPHTNPADNRDFRVIEFVGQPGSGSLTGVRFHIYSPVDPPSWVGNLGAGLQVFANNGVFSDNVVQYGAATGAFSSGGLRSIIQGNLGNQVVSALTRGLGNVPTPAGYANTTAFWTDPSQAFPAGEPSSLYAKFLHTGMIGSSSIFIDGRVYAFPYSDQGDQAAFFAVNRPTSIGVTLGPWSGTFTPPNNDTPAVDPPSDPPTPPAPPPPPPPTTPISSTLYLRDSGVLGGEPVPTASTQQIASAGGMNHDSVPTNAEVFQLTGLIGTYQSGQETRFEILLDAGHQVGNGTQLRVSYDFNSDGTFDRVETYRYFATNDVPGWETYTHASGLRQATGSFANLVNGTVKVELWNAIGRAPVTVATGGSEGLSSRVHLPFANLVRLGDFGDLPPVGPPTPIDPTPPFDPPPPVDPPSPPGPTTPLGDTFYYHNTQVLSPDPVTEPQSQTIASAAGRNHDGTPSAPLVYQLSSLTGTHDSARQTEFKLLLDAGTAVANGTQVRVSYDFNGDGAFDRIETYRYFATNDVPGWEEYTQAVGLRSVSGAFGNLVNGSVRVEIWNAIGQSSVAVKTGGSDNLRSMLRLPFSSLSQNG